MNALEEMNTVRKDGRQFKPTKTAHPAHMTQKFSDF